MQPFDYSKELAPVVTAVLLESMDDLQRLVKEGADINAQDQLGRSALIMAIDQDYANPDWVEFLIASGININLQDNDGDTALDLARFRANNQAIGLLCRHNALGKDGPSAKEQQWDQIYDAFDQADSIKFMNKDLSNKLENN
jgi:ankyrin repeat protein